MDIFQEYINKYDNFKKNIVYDFKLGYGGIGDCIKYFMRLLDICIKHDIKLYYMKNNILLENFLVLKHDKMYINKETFLNNTIYIKNMKNIENILDDTYYIINPQVIIDNYVCNNYVWDNDNIFVLIPEIFIFSEEVIINSNSLLKECNINDKNYISIHVRLGDKFMIINCSHKVCPEDTRDYSETALYNFIESNYNNNIILFSDNNDYKLKIKSKYSNIYILNVDIAHTSYNITDKETLDTCSEFYILSNSNHIYATALSGFSHISPYFKNKPFSII